MQMVGADWIKSDKREDDLSGRPGGLVQVYFLKASNFPSTAKGTENFTKSYIAEMCSTRGQQILFYR
jgi:hypothetical protein